MSKPRPFSVGTHLGKVRPRNEDFVDEPQMDAAVVGTKGMLFIVADGVGGAKDGDVASQMAVRAMRDAFNAQPHPDVRECLSIAISAANTAVFREGQRRGKSMATTITAAVIRPDGIVTANVGDSRVYVCNKARGTMQQLTVDHTELQDAVTHRKISAEAARQMPRSGAITRAIGIDAYVTADVAMHPTAIEKGSVLLLCTDGLYSEVPDGVMATVLRKAPPDEAVRRLTLMALTAGGRDNVTLAVVDVDRVVEVVKGEMKRVGGTTAPISAGPEASAGGPGDGRQAGKREYARTIGDAEGGGGSAPTADVVHATLGRRVHREGGTRVLDQGLSANEGTAIVEGLTGPAVGKATGGVGQTGRRWPAVGPVVGMGMAAGLVAIVVLSKLPSKLPPSGDPDVDVSKQVAQVPTADQLEPTPRPIPSASALASPASKDTDPLAAAAYPTDTPPATFTSAPVPTGVPSTGTIRPPSTPTPSIGASSKLTLHVDIAASGCIHIYWEPTRAGYDMDVRACMGDCAPLGIYAGDSGFWWDPGVTLNNRPDLTGASGTYHFQVVAQDGSAKSDVISKTWGGGTCNRAPDKEPTKDVH